MKTKTPKITQTGFVYHIALIAMVVIGVVVGYGAYFRVSSSTNTYAATTLPEYNKVSKNYRNLYNTATREYFEQSEGYKNATCKPEDVKIVYYKKGDRVPSWGDTKYQANAWSTIGAAYPEQKIPNDYWPDKHQKWPKGAYCTIHWNITQPPDSNKSIYATTIPEQCLQFMHEYGHLIGRLHSNDVNSVMYAPSISEIYYAVDHDLPFPRDENKDKLAAKTICPSEADLLKKYNKKPSTNNAKVTQPPKAKPVKIVLSKTEIDGLCEDIANNQGSDQRAWRLRTCRSGAKIGLHDYKANQKTDAACYKKGRSKDVQYVCDWGRHKAIERLNQKYGARSVN